MVERLERIAEVDKTNIQIKEGLKDYNKNIKPLYAKKELPKSVEYGCNDTCVCDCVCNCYCVCDQQYLK